VIAALAASGPVATLATPRRARWALVVVHLPMIGYLTSVCWTGLGVYSADPHRAVDVPVALALGLTQLTLSLRTASGRAGPERFALWALVLALAVTPAVQHPDLRWLVAVWFPAAAGGMVFAGWARAVAFAAPIVVALVRVGVLNDDPNLSRAVYYLAYSLAIFALGAGCLLAAARVVQVVTELSASRAELADVASRAERQRAGRDLHDTLGQRLSAISIKGDLAGALWPAQPEAAAREIAEIATIAAQAWRELDNVARDAQEIAFADEAARAVALLHSAGVFTELRDHRPPLPPDVDRLLGWAIREASTNLLRHSAAATCGISVGPGGSGVLLEVVNDGAGRPSGRLGGLAGLAERARALDGVVAAGRVGRDGFRLQVAVPLEPR
jgi:two-component system, NarL family, sensor histidine kinase DesK